MKIAFYRSIEPEAAFKAVAEDHDWASAAALHLAP
jgi:hypothetical protein